MFKEKAFSNPEEEEDDEDEFLKETVVKKKVSPGDEKYLLEQQRVAEDESSNDVFGYNLWKFYQASKNIKIEDTEKRFLSRGRETKEKLVSLLLSGDKVVRGNAIQFITTGFSRSEAACVVMEKYLKEVKDSEDTKEDKSRILAREFLGLLRREDCPRDVLEIIALLYEGNRLQIEEYQKKLNEEQIPAIMATFKTFYLSLLSMRYSLSKEVTERIKVKLDSVSFCVVDGLSSEIENLGGYFSARKNQISIALPYFDRVEEIINHEALHAASGRTVLKEAATLGGAEDSFFESYSHTRSGLNYEGPSLENGRFVWLNEGITQTLTMEGLASIKRAESMIFRRKAEKPESNVYKSEVELVALLLTSGKKDIPFKIFVQAYFEDYEPERGDEAIPKWKALQQAITESYGPNFLVSLDKRIQKEGVQAAIDGLRSGEFKGTP